MSQKASWFSKLGSVGCGQTDKSLGGLIYRWILEVELINTMMCFISLHAFTLNRYDLDFEIEHIGMSRKFAYANCNLHFHQSYKTY